MKEIYKHEIGGDGAMASLSADEVNLVLQLAYPLEKLLKPLNDLIDGAVDKVEAAIPGDWDKALLEPIRLEAKAALMKLVNG